MVGDNDTGPGQRTPVTGQRRKSDLVGHLSLRQLEMGGWSREEIREKTAHSEWQAVATFLEGR